MKEQDEFSSAITYKASKQEAQKRRQSMHSNRKLSECELISVPDLQSHGLRASLAPEPSSDSNAHLQRGTVSWDACFSYLLPEMAPSAAFLSCYALPVKYIDQGSDQLLVGNGICAIERRKEASTACQIPHTSSAL